MSLSREELLRYARHLVLPNVGEAGQEKLKAARVLVVGAGGLGSPAALYLAAAGVGTLGLVDFDVVDVSNLQRQILFGTSTVGQPKTDAASRRIADMNPHVRVRTHDARLTSANALDIMRDYDVIVDGTDNFATRYLTNDACVLLGTPNVFGSVYRFEGQASVFATKDGPCYRCIFPTPPPPDSVPSCAEGGVLGVLPGLIGTIQATETVKLILGVGDTLAGRLLLFDALSMRMQTVEVQRDPTCPACGTREITALIDYDAFCGASSASRDDLGDDVTPEAVAQRMRRPNPPDLIDVREPYEWQIARIPGARLVPLAELPHAMSTLDSTRDIIVYCHSGIRSDAAARHLRAAGFRAANMTGGIDRWSREVDPSVPRYR